MTEQGSPTDWNASFAFLTLRLWLGMRALITGLEKFSDSRTIQIPLLGSDGQPDPSGAMVEVTEKFYAFSSYHAVPDSLHTALSREPLLPGFLTTPFYALLGWALIAFGVMLLAGAFTRISLVAMGVIYMALTVGLILIKQDPGVAWLAIHVGLIAYALTLSRHNRFTLTKS